MEARSGCAPVAPTTATEKYFELIGHPYSASGPSSRFFTTAEPFFNKIHALPTPWDPFYTARTQLGGDVRGDLREIELRKKIKYKLS